MEQSIGGILAWEDPGRVGGRGVLGRYLHRQRLGHRCFQREASANFPTFSWFCRQSTLPAKTPDPFRSSRG